METRISDDSNTLGLESEREKVPEILSFQPHAWDEVSGSECWRRMNR